MNNLTEKQLNDQIDDQLVELSNLNRSLRRAEDLTTKQYTANRMYNRITTLRIRVDNLLTGIQENVKDGDKQCNVD